VAKSGEREGKGKGGKGTTIWKEGCKLLKEKNPRGLKIRKCVITASYVVYNPGRKGEKRKKGRVEGGKRGNHRALIYLKGGEPPYFLQAGR